MNSNNLVVDSFLEHSRGLVINNPNYGLVPFQLWEHQCDVIDSLVINRRICVATARQMGMTTLMLAFIHWYVTAIPNKTVFYTSHNQTMLNVSREFFRQLDPNIEYKSVNSQEIRLKNESRVLFKRFESGHGTCGYCINLLAVDNAAYIKNVTDGWDVCVNSLHNDGFIWINSTPFGCNNWFAKVYGGKNMFKKIHLPWFKRKDRDEGWYKNTRCLMDEKTWRSELDAEFI